MLGDAVAEKEDFLERSLREGLANEASDDEDEEACHGDAQRSKTTRCQSRLDQQFDKPRLMKSALLEAMQKPTPHRKHPQEFIQGEVT
jgi:hypothetical protein